MPTEAEIKAALEMLESNWPDENPKRIANKIILAAYRDAKIENIRLRAAIEDIAVRAALESRSDGK